MEEERRTLRSRELSKTAIVCKAHFTENDYIEETIHGKTNSNLDITFI
jgi:hypothetical protein